MRNTLLLLMIACSPTVQGKALAPALSGKRVAVTGRGYTQGVENSLLALGSNRLKLMSRSEQNAIAAEKQIQYGGDFSDDQVVSLGRQMGAELLFVLRDDVRKVEQREEPSLENCAFNFADRQTDTPEERATRTTQRNECNTRNAVERKRAAETPPRIYNHYSANVRVVDITTGEVVAFGDAKVADGQAGLTCVYPCTRDKATDLAVRAILGLPLE